MSKYKEVKLKNGLKVITISLEQTKAVTALVLLPCGSRYERKNINGVSHFIEHMIFKGTEKRPTALDISQELDGVGASYNAFTGKDHTGYYIKVKRDKLELALDVLSDILFFSRFAKEEIERERGVICEEIKMYQDNPLLYIEDLFEQTIFQKSSLGWMISGPQETVQKITHQQILNYKNEFYQPKNMILTLAGNFDKKRAEKLINKYFGGIKSVRKKTKTFPKFKYKYHKLPRVNLRFQKTDQLQIALGFPAYSYFHPKIYALALLSVILGGNMSSRLFVEIREKKGLAYYIRTSSNIYQDTGCFLIRAGIDKDNLGKTLNIIFNELRKIKKEEVSKKELKKAKDFLCGRLILSLEDSANIASFYGIQNLLTKKILEPEEKIKKIKQVNAKDIQRVAQEIIRDNRINFALIGKVKEKKELLKILATKAI